MAGRMLQHRALAHPSRVRLLEALRVCEAPLSTDELAADLGLHPNTVRGHLLVLEEAELVLSTTELRRRPGRPRRLFAAVPEGAEQELALLAGALSSSLELLPEGVGISLSGGRSWGRVLIERLEPGREPDEAACVERITALLRRRGFVPETLPDKLVMHRCPFRELAERYPRVVCSFHAGLIEGALEELGAPIVLEDLEAWATSSTCVAHLAPRVPV